MPLIGRCQRTTRRGGTTSAVPLSVPWRERLAARRRLSLIDAHRPWGESHLVLYGLPLHVTNDLEVFAQVTATEIHDITFLVCNLVGSLRLGDQLMRIEVSLDGFVLRVRVLLAEGEEHRIHKELLGLYLYTH